MKGYWCQMSLHKAWPPLSENTIVCSPSRQKLMQEITSKLQSKCLRPQTTDTYVCQKNVRVGTPQYFEWIEGFAAILLLAYGKRIGINIYYR